MNPSSSPSSNPHKGRTGLARIAHAARYSLAGLRAAFRHESAFRQEAVLAAFMLPAAFWLGRSAFEVLLLVAAVLLVLIVELMNSAVEAVVDRVGYEHHELSGRAKDMGSAAVLLSLLLCLAVWLTVAWQRFANV
jgi:diacylglycerol kinase (ATP)